MALVDDGQIPRLDDGESAREQAQPSTSPVLGRPAPAVKNWSLTEASKYEKRSPKKKAGVRTRPSPSPPSQGGSELLGGSFSTDAGMSNFWQGGGVAPFLSPIQSKAAGSSTAVCAARSS